MKHDYLESSMKPILDVMEDVKRKAVTRLTFENLHQHEDITRPTGRFYRNPEGYAMEKYHYYQCFKCKKVQSYKIQSTYDISNPDISMYPLISKTDLTTFLNFIFNISNY